MVPSIIRPLLVKRGGRDVVEFGGSTFESGGHGGVSRVRAGMQQRRHACEPAGAADSLSPQRAKLPTTYLQRAYYMITSCFCVSGRHRRACTCILPGAVVLQCQVGSPCLMHLMAAGAVLYVWFSAPALQPFRYSNSSANLALSAII